MSKGLKKASHGKTKSFKVPTSTGKTTGKPLGGKKTSKKK